MNGGQGVKKRRSYRPTVEALEALRLLSSATQALPDLAVERNALPLSAITPNPLDLATTNQAWDQALASSHLADILGPSLSASTPSLQLAPTAGDINAGLTQLNKYLSRAWYRAGIPPQIHDDASQAVYVSLLQNLGRTRFDQLLGDVGQNGVRDVLSRETADGPDFFRAIDTVKKRAQRERTYQPLDAIDVSSAQPGDDARALWRSTLQEAIDQSLTPREASLVYDTLMGKTPAEIATQWGVASKTVSNEKTRVIQKLREALVADLTD